MEPKIEQKKERTVISPDEDKDQDKGELSEDELEDISGGKATLQDFHFVKKIDKASNNLI